MRFKKVILIAVVMVFAAASGALAQPFPAFPNNSSIFQNVSGTFSNLTGIAKRLNVKYVTSATPVTPIIDRSGADKGLLFQSTSDNFWQFADTVVFTGTGDRLDIDGFLMPRNGRSATGSAAFTFTSLVSGTQATGVQLTITGGAVVSVVKNRAGTQAKVTVFNFQASEVSYTTFRNTTAISVIHGDAVMSLTPMMKALTNHSLPIP
ncbi:MAG: hypothetical protein WA666_07175 [Nitrospirota bacterium]